MENLTKRQKWVLNNLPSKSFAPFQMTCWAAEGKGKEVEKQADAAFAAHADAWRAGKVA